MSPECRQHHGHRRRRTHPLRPPPGLAEGLQRRRPRCGGDPGCTREVRGPGLGGPVRHHGPGADRGGAGQMPARQAAIKAGIGWDVPTLTINKMCLSGIDAIALADQLIRAGEFDVVVAGGQESMTQAPPHLLAGSRGGFKYGNTELVDHLAFDGLHDAFTDQPMGGADRAGQRQGRLHPRAAGRIRRPQPPARRRRLEERRVRRRGRAGLHPAAQG